VPEQQTKRRAAEAPIFTQAIVTTKFLRATRAGRHGLMKAKALPLIWINDQMPWQTSTTAVFMIIVIFRLHGLTSSVSLLTVSAI
jgi:hypothetical protein